MWIKNSKGWLLNTDFFRGITYRSGLDATVAWTGDAESEEFICSGDAIDYIGEALCRGQSYLEVSDCE
jgi:hypothetical protein